MRSFIGLIGAGLLLAASSYPEPPPVEPGEVQRGSVLMGCLQESGMGGYVITDGTVDHAIVLEDDKLEEHVGKWVKLDGDSVTAGGMEHFRVRTVTPMIPSCDEGFAQTFRRKATAELRNPQGDPVGTAEITQTPHGVLLQVDFENMPPGRHAFHVHEKGSCEPPDFKSAGGHFNPTGVGHGFLTGESHHAGDMPNFEVPASGEIMLERINSRVSLSEQGKSSLFRGEGTALVVHEGTDDYKSQPSGAAGARIACGVIEGSQ